MYIREFPYENLTFFPDKLYQKFFLFQFLGAQGILHTEIGSIWRNSWPDGNDQFLKFVIREIRKFRMKY